ncbi:hypothetical protein OESDEN_19009 [Oesophagostomum dentatum]|uniref:Uncharacterized protein n=1 Tax=Oesophagostomum dentatum TaxID=61180 RepID=A0A0B1SDL4_OESDE|nr:hypothetical protein OESDEN_19009 [Oesophagostomum dentatum]
MVSIKMPDLPVRKVGDTQILEARTAPTQSISYVLKTALSHSVVQPTTLEECHTQASTPSLHTAKKTIKNEPSTEGGELRQVLSLKSGFSSAESSQSKDTKENAKSTAILEKKAASAPAGSKESVQDSPKKI